MEQPPHAAGAQSLGLRHRFERKIPLRRERRFQRRICLRHRPRDGHADAYRECPLSQRQCPNINCRVELTININPGPYTWAGVLYRQIFRPRSGASRYHDTMQTNQYVNMFGAIIRKTTLPLMLLLLAACGGHGSSNDAALQTIAITPASPSQRLGMTLQLVATGTYSDGTTRDVSSTSTWSSTKASVAEVSTAGLVSTVGIGSSTITAALGAVTGSATMTVTPGPATVSVLHTFGIPTSTSDGATPAGTPIQASDGNFYGTTAEGGAYVDCDPRLGHGCGTVFKITPDGVESVLHSFDICDGANPNGSLIQASDGNFYGVTTRGGSTCQEAYGSGAVFKITPDGVESVLHSFGASPSDGLTPNGSLIQASDGNIYGATETGGANSCPYFEDNSCGTVFKITLAGVETILYSFGASASDGFGPLGSLIQASDGNFYGTTISGGANGAGTVFKLTPAGIETVLYSFSGPKPTTPVQGPFLIQASDGNFYGTTVSGGANNAGTVFMITPAGVETELYSFGASASDGSSPAGPLKQASDGNFYGTTTSGGANGAGAAFMITPAGIETVLYSFGASASDAASPIGSLIQANDGNFYGASLSHDAPSNFDAMGTIFKLVP